MVRAFNRELDRTFDNLGFLSKRCVRRLLVSIPNRWIRVYKG